MYHLSYWRIDFTERGYRQLQQQTVHVLAGEDAANPAALNKKTFNKKVKRYSTTLYKMLLLKK